MTYVIMLLSLALCVTTVGWILEARETLVQSHRADELGRQVHFWRSAWAKMRNQRDTFAPVRRLATRRVQRAELN